MTMTARQILEQARNEGWALGAFNAGSLEIAQAIFQAAKDQQAPLIIETSAGEAEHFGLGNFLNVVENFREETGLPVLTNYDHGPGIEECQLAIEAGYNQIHFDGSNLPLEENIKITKLLAEQAHQKGILLEAEMDKIMGESRPHEDIAESVQAMANYTDPDRAADFVKETSCDILAVFVGNIHGTYQTVKRLDIERLGMIRDKVDCFLSLHGGSGLVQEDIKAAIKLGVVKVNINTELRVTYRQTLENVLRGSDEVAVYKIMPPVMAAVQKVVEDKIVLFGGSGKAIAGVQQDA